MLRENRQLIASELSPEDLPPHDRQLLDDAGVRDPDIDLRLGIQKLKEHAAASMNADERGTQRGAAEIAVREAERIEKELPEADSEGGGVRQPPNRPRGRPFKGLGGIGKGFGLVIADTMALVDWPIVAPEAVKAGALGSFALGWEGIMSGLGDLRGE